MRSGRSSSVRAIALCLAFGVNALFMLLLLFSRERLAAEPEASGMVWIVAGMEQSRTPLPRSTAPAGVPRVQARAGTSTTSPAAVAAATTLQPASEAPSAPASRSIDWYAEAEEVAASALQDSEQDAQGSAPESSARTQVRPESFWIPPMQGTTEQLPGGGTRVWTSDLCYREYNPTDPDPFKGGFRNGGRTVCKPRSMEERQSEARAEAIADAVRRKRSTLRPEPVPPAPGSGVRIP